MSALPNQSLLREQHEPHRARGQRYPFETVPAQPAYRLGLNPQTVRLIRLAHRQCTLDKSYLTAL